MFNKILAMAIVMPLISPVGAIGYSSDIQKVQTSLILPICVNQAGDVNGDGQITPADAKLAIDHYFGEIRLTGCAFKAADMNKDGQITPADALAIIRLYQSDNILAGDVNLDGQITLADVKLALDHYFGRIVLTGRAFKAADMNKDGQITPADALAILKLYRQK